VNRANKLTVSRIFLAFVCIGFIAQDTFPFLVGGLILFIAASITDFFDGYIARHHNMVSDLGKILDPIADKILIVGVFLAFLQLGVVNAWMVSAIMLREFIVTSVRLYGLNKGAVLEAQMLGKHKTFSQIAGIVAILLILILSKSLRGNAIVNLLRFRLIPVIMCYIVFITLFSGVSYIWANRKTIKTF